MRGLGTRRWRRGGPDGIGFLGQAGRDLPAGGPGLRGFCLGGLGRDASARERGRG